MASQVAIINLGLNHIGQKAISEPTEATVQAQSVARVWDYVLEETLRSFDWGFARVCAALALVSDYTPLNFTYAYAYPSKALIIWKLTYDGDDEDSIGEKYKVLYAPANNQRVILTDLEDAYAVYSYNVTDTTKFDPFFVTALSHRLAAEVAVPLNGDKAMAKDEIVIFNNLISEAKRLGFGENRRGHPANEESAYVDARE